MYLKREKNAETRRMYNENGRQYRRIRTIPTQHQESMIPLPHREQHVTTSTNVFHLGQGKTDFK